MGFKVKTEKFAEIEELKNIKDKKYAGGLGLTSMILLTPVVLKIAGFSPLNIDFPAVQRRKFLKVAGSLLAGLMVVPIVEACGPDTSTATVAPAATPQATTSSMGADAIATTQATTAPDATATTPAGGNPTATAGTGAAVMANSKDLVAGSAIAIQDNNKKPVVLYKTTGGDIAAYSAICTHQGCKTVFKAATHTMNCPCHGSVFDLEHGAARTAGPAQKPLTKLSVKIDQATGDIFLM